MAASVDPNRPAITPPPGIKSNFIDPPSQAGSIIVLEAIFIPLMVLAVSARVWVRTGITKTWGADDVACLLAAAGSIVHMIIYTQTFPLGFGRHLWDIRAITLLSPSAARVLSANGVAYPWAIGFAKLSILLLYRRIFDVYRQMQVAIWLGIVVNVVLYPTFAGLSIGGMVICTGLAQADNSYCLFNAGIMVLVTSIVNVITDFYILLLPLPRIFQLQLHGRRKLGLILVFASGLGACATSLARLVNFSIHIHSKDVLWVQGVNAQFTVVEMNIAIVVACASCFPAFSVRMRLVGASLYHSVTRLVTSITSSSNTRRDEGDPSFLGAASGKPESSHEGWHDDRQQQRLQGLRRAGSHELQPSLKTHEVNVFAAYTIPLSRRGPEGSHLSREHSSLDEGLALPGNRT